MAPVKPTAGRRALDDRAADRQAHPHPPGLGRKEGIEHSLGDRRLDSGSGILHRHEGTYASFGSRPDPKEARAIGYGAHRFHTIHDQVEHYLLKLHPIAITEGDGSINS